jgi:hypothetical protein
VPSHNKVVNVGFASGKLHLLLAGSNFFFLFFSSLVAEWAEKYSYRAM